MKQRSSKKKEPKPKKEVKEKKIAKAPVVKKESAPKIKKDRRARAPKKREAKKEKSHDLKIIDTKPKSTITPIQIQRILNTGHPDDLFITLKLLDENQSVKLLAYFRKHHSQMHKKKDLAKVIMAAKTRVELLAAVKNYLIGAMKKDYDDMKQTASTLRKKGVDVLIEEFKIMRIPAKIRMFEATENKLDYYAAKKMVDETKQAVENLKPIKLK